MSNPRKKCTMINWGGMILYMTLQKGATTYVHLHQQKKVTLQKIASPGQPSIDRKWWDKFQRVAKLQNRRFFLKIHLSMQKGCALPWASAGPHPWSRGLWKTASCQPGSQVPGIHFFPVSDWGGGRYGMLPTQASRKYFFYLDIRGVNLLDVGRWAPGN